MPRSLALIPLLALVLVLPACGRRERESASTHADSSYGGGAVPPTGSRTQVTFVEVAPHVRRVALPLGAGADSLVLSGSRPGAAARWDVTRPAGPERFPSEVARLDATLEAAGTVDLHHDGSREAFFVMASGGAGLTNRELDLYCPRAGRLVTLTLTFMHDDAQPVPAVVRSDELEQPAFAAEAGFLEGVKRDYGWVDDATLAARPDDPRQAFYFWRMDNAGHADGAPMKVRRFRGRHVATGEAADSLAIAGVTYTAYANSGVVAYDPARDEHWVVFHPEDAHAGPTRLVAAGDVLVIGTHGEGLAAVKTTTLALKHVRVLGDDDIRSLALHGGTLVVNGETHVALPAF